MMGQSIFLTGVLYAAFGHIIIKSTEAFPDRKALRLGAMAYAVGLVIALVGGIWMIWS